MIRIYLILAFVAFGFVKAKAQFDVNLLNSQLRKYEFRLADLMGSRGSSYRALVPSLSTLLSNLKLYAGKDTGFSFLFYHHENDTLHIWSINQMGVEAYQAQRVSAQELNALEINLKQSLRYGESAQRGAVLPVNKGKDMIQDNIFSASKLLIPDNIAAVLLRKSKALILPSLNIGSFPFYILKPWKDSLDLIDRLTVAVLPSFSDFFKFMEYNKTFFEQMEDYYTNDSAVFHLDGKPLVIGDPGFSKNCASGLERLPGAKKEASLVAGKLKVEMLTDDKAGSSVILDKMRTSDFIYFACHGIADAGDPLNGSYLLVSDFEDHCGKLTAKEIQQTRLLPMALVFLSACRTGSGKTHEGGIIGVSRAFIIAGASAVVMSLWDVNDKATGEMMPQVVDSLFMYKPFFPATQIREALLDYRKKNPNPEYWGAFTMFGVPHPPNFKMKLELN